MGDRDPLCGLENAGFQARIDPFLPRRTAQPVGRAVSFGFLLGDAHFSTTAGSGLQLRRWSMTDNAIATVFLCLIERFIGDFNQVIWGFERMR